MVFDPIIIALVMSSILLGATMAAASALGLVIQRRWDPASGSALQIRLERRTYLVSTLLAYVMAFEILSLFLFAYAGEDLHSLFVGAMCAAGTFNVNNYGYPTLTLKFVNALLCGLWLVMNHADNQAPDYPLIRPKYRLLMPIAVLVLLEGVLQYAYFSNLEPNLITSCCGTLFSEDAATVSGHIAHLPPVAVQTLFFFSVILLMRTGIGFLKADGSPMLFAGLSAWMVVLSLIAMVSFISVYYYELPTHHCPFCVLQKEYGYIGYPLYLLLILGGVSGAGVGVLHHYSRGSLAEIVPGIQRRLCGAAMIAFGLLAAIALYPIVFSSFRLHGY